MNNKNFVLGLATLALSISNAPNAQAVVIFDNGYAADSPGGSSFSDFAYPQQIANDFILNVNTTFNEIQWRGGSITPWTSPDDFTIRIFADNAGTVGVSPLYQFRLKDDLFGNGVVSLSKTYEKNNGQYDVYRYNALIPNLTLANSTTYWLSILNNTAQGSGNAWLWSASNQNYSYILGSLKYRSIDGQTWLNTSGEQAFSLNYNSVPSPPPLPPQSVPEPFTIIGTLIGGTAAFRMRKKLKAIPD